jgi:hypothetical protein
MSPRRGPEIKLAEAGSFRKVLSPGLMVAAMILTFTYPAGGLEGEGTLRSSRLQFWATQRAFIVLIVGLAEEWLS